jgi:hypothetical protein
MLAQLPGFLGARGWLQLAYPRARGCTFCGYCFQGCYEPRNAPRNLFAKRSTDNSYMPMALTADLWRKGGRAVTLLTDSFATRIGTVSEGGATVAAVPASNSRSESAQCAKTRSRSPSSLSPV